MEVSLALPTLSLRGVSLAVLATMLEMLKGNLGWGRSRGVEEAAGREGEGGGKGGRGEKEVLCQEQEEGAERGPASLQPPVTDTWGGDGGHYDEDDCVDSDDDDNGDNVYNNVTDTDGDDMDKVEYEYTDTNEDDNEGRDDETSIGLE